MIDFYFISEESSSVDLYQASETNESSKDSDRASQSLQRDLGRTTAAAIHFNASLACRKDVWWHLKYRIYSLTGSIARSAKRRLFKLLRGRFWGFRPARATRCTDKDDIYVKFHLHWYNDKGIGPQNWNFYWYLIKMWNINAPQGLCFSRFSQNLQNLYLVSGWV